jgi:CheY-like chemotaxis protein
MVLVVDPDRATGLLLRGRLEQDHGAKVEIATTYDEALDVLGNAARPTSLLMLEPALPNLEGDALLLLLRQHRARIHVTLHGQSPPESLPFPDNFVGAAAYTHLATSAIACAAAEAVLAAGLTVHDIVDRRIVPHTLDWKSAIAIYSADPGQPFPLSVRT